MTVEDNVAPELIAELAASAGYAARRAAVEAFNASHSVLKKGLALTPVKFGISFTTTHLNQAGALVLVYADGSIQLNHGGTEMGQGLMIKVAQIVADVFAVPIETVKVTATRTDKVPNTSATAASSGADLNGMAAQRRRRDDPAAPATQFARRASPDSAELELRRALPPRPSRRASRSRRPASTRRPKSTTTAPPTAAGPSSISLMARR